MRTWTSKLDACRRPAGLTAVMAAIILTPTASCNHEKEPPPVAYMGPTLASEQLGVTDPPADPTGFVILERRPTVGRFPGAVAVCRLEPPKGYFAPEDRDENTRHLWWVRTIHWEEAMGWNDLCNRIPAIRELIVLDKYATINPDSDLSEITRVAGRQEAGLCLVYGPAPAGPDNAGLWGVILDTQTGEQVAFLRAEAGPVDYEPPRSDRLEKDWRHRDPNYLAVVRFQQEVRKCLLALIHRDEAPATTQPSPWHDHSSQPDLDIFMLPGHNYRTPGW